MYFDEAVLENGGGWTDAVALSLVLRGHDAFQIAALVRAQAGASERLTETLEQGRAFAATVSALGPEVPALPTVEAIRKSEDYKIEKVKELIKKDR